ncbi:MAG: DUF3108 domain-containing protein [Muribaculaceae bacterium]|nr:DUF3108 domain-containing protein [Muribaculaceae bacterium]
MKGIIKTIIAGLCLILAFGTASAADTKFADETLKYVITYKWGLITKDSGEATLSIKNQGSKYYIRLTGKTKPWADGLFKVRDTLVSVMDKAKFHPLSYTKIAHEGDWHRKDVIEYSYTGTNVKGNASVYKEKKGNVKTENFELSSSGDTFDMLSVFYWIRSIDLANIETGKKLTATLFSESREETVKIWKVGEGSVKMRDGSKREAWHIKFTFTSKGGKKTSDDIEAWISKDGKRVPLEIKGKLPLGHVCAYLI